MSNTLANAIEAEFDDETELTEGYDVRNLDATVVYADFDPFSDDTLGSGMVGSSNPVFLSTGGANEFDKLARASGVDMEPLALPRSDDFVPPPPPLDSFGPGMVLDSMPPPPPPDDRSSGSF